MEEVGGGGREKMVGGEHRREDDPIFSMMFIYAFHSPLQHNYFNKQQSIFKQHTLVQLFVQ